MEIEKSNHQQLHALASKINDGLKHMVSSAIEIGRSLHEARSMFADDKDFTEWHTENTHIKAYRTAMAYIQVYHKFNGHPLIGVVCYSVLQELVSAPDSVIDEVKQLTQSGEKITVADARKMVKEAKSPDVVDTLEEPDVPLVGASGDAVDEVKQLSRSGEGVIVAGEEIDEKVRPPVGRPFASFEEKKAPSPSDRERELLFCSELVRIKTAVDPWNVIGLSQFFDNVPTADTIGYIKVGLMGKYKQQPDVMAILHEAFSKIELQLYL